MADLDKKNRVRKDVSVFKKPAIFVPENRGMSDCCVPFLTLVDETDLSSHRNDENSAWSLGETVTFELRKNGVVTSYVPVSYPFPNETNAWYTTIPWRDVFLMDGYGVYELYMTVDFAGISQTSLWSKYDVQPYQNTAGKYLGKGTVRLKSVFNDVNTLEGIDFTGAYVVDTLRFKAKFGYWNPLTDVDNVQYTDAEKMKVRREDLTEYELRVDLHSECIIDRLRFHLVAENACYITDHNADNYTYKYLDYPVIVKSGFEPNWIDGTRKVKGVAKFEDKKKMTKTHFQDNDTNGKFDPPKNATLPAKIIDSGIEVQVPSGQTYECSTVVNEKYIELMKDTFKGRSVIDSATFEAESCLVNELTDIGVNLLDTASLIITPNSQKAGILKAVKPFENTGDLSVVRATSATRVNSSGLIESVASNVPRLDYTNGSCPTILVEPQRTNLLLNSATVATQTIASLAQVYTLSFYGTGTITISGTHSATVVGTGTTRKTYTFTAIVGALVLTVSGTCTNGQLEAGSYATSYIPTTSASVTRNADVISKTGISSLIGQTEGTLFVDELFDDNVTNNGGLDDTLISLSDGTTNNLISIFHYGRSLGSSDRKVLFFIRLSNVTQVAIFSSTLTSGRYKIALAYKNNDVVAYINGTQIGTDTSASIPATSVINLVDGITTNVATKTVNFNLASLWKTRLTNTQLAELTAI